MAMPNNLVFVRHGESDGNVARRGERRGDESLFTPEFRETPGHRWNLTPRGVEQAKCAGQFILEHFGVDAFDRYYASTYVRPRHTAGFIGKIACPNAKWAYDRRLRERNWGDLETIPFNEYAETYPVNAKRKFTDSLYWAPVGGGESIADVSNRFRDHLTTLHRECEGRNVLESVHGEKMWVARLVLEYMSDEDWAESENDRSLNIGNCDVLHYTSVDPDTGDQARHLHWVSHSKTWQEDDNGVIVSVYEPGSWKYFEKPLYTNDDLLADAPGYYSPDGM